MNNVLAINFNSIEEVFITELEKDNWFEVLEGGMLLLGKPVNMVKVDFEEVFG